MTHQPTAYILIAIITFFTLLSLFNSPPFFFILVHIESTSRKNFQKRYWDFEFGWGNTWGTLISDSEFRAELRPIHVTQLKGG